MKPYLFDSESVETLIDQVRECYREAREAGDALAVIERDKLDALYRLALRVADMRHGVAIGLHAHREGVTTYEFAIAQGESFDCEAFKHYLSDDFETDREDESVDLLYPDSFIRIKDGQPQQ